ncbi:hypothetical protein FB45DRAFT_1131093 [Roridomyces roridus]|uniref:Uncharacterized protein n=1 Tax=Roridomyces roridus TaxID=1738132 RepID=A0AAD7B2C9_9AGAR|nr:hypothetical protein FB45DRAFT_1131093 [Roridomyces roridus]
MSESVSEDQADDEISQEMLLQSDETFMSGKFAVRKHAFGNRGRLIYAPRPSRPPCQSHQNSWPSSLTASRATREGLGPSITRNKAVEQRHAHLITYPGLAGVPSSSTLPSFLPLRPTARTFLSSLCLDNIMVHNNMCCFESAGYEMKLCKRCKTVWYCVSDILSTGATKRSQFDKVLDKWIAGAGSSHIEEACMKALQAYPSVESVSQKFVLLTLRWTDDCESTGVFEVERADVHDRADLSRVTRLSDEASRAMVQHIGKWDAKSRRREMDPGAVTAMAVMVVEAGGKLSVRFQPLPLKLDIRVTPCSIM